MTAEAPLAAPAPTVRAIATVTAKLLGVDVLAIVGTSRAPRRVLARQLTMYVAANVYGHSQANIARVLRRDHTTVSHGALRIEERKECDAEVSALVAEIPNVLGRGVERSPAPAKRKVVAPTHSMESAAWFNEASRLRHLGWSITALSRRYDAPPKDLAQIFGAEFY